MRTVCLTTVQMKQYYNWEKIVLYDVGQSYNIILRNELKINRKRKNCITFHNLFANHDNIHIRSKINFKYNKLYQKKLKLELINKDKVACNNDQIYPHKEDTKNICTKKSLIELINKDKIAYNNDKIYPHKEDTKNISPWLDFTKLLIGVIVLQ